MLITLTAIDSRLSDIVIDPRTILNVVYIKSAYLLVITFSSSTYSVCFPSHLYKENLGEIYRLIKLRRSRFN